jgi:SDR family mycofactocin-dependent oxidoreductase
MEGKVALVTGAAGGLGRAHAIRLAQEGADVIVTDLGAADEVTATADDLSETAAAVRTVGRDAFMGYADVRSQEQLQAVVDRGIDALGRLDVVCANAGISTQGVSWKLSEEDWETTIQINLTGVWRTVKATVPFLIDQDEGGSIVITGSTASIKGFGGALHYTASKHGVVGLMKALVNEVSRHRIRVNLVAPAATNTAMIHNDGSREFFGFPPDVSDEEYGAAFQAMNALPVPWVEPEDISNAILWLASDEARYVTGTVLPVDAGFCTKVG